MTSSAREVLKWLAVVLMTCDHVAKIIYGGYVPGLSEAGRVAFPLFALGLSRVVLPAPRGRRTFYGYYVGHLAFLGLVALILPP